MPFEIHHTASVHHTAVFGPNVKIGPNVYIGPFCVIGMYAEQPNEPHPAVPEGHVIISQGAVLTKHVTVDAPTGGLHTRVFSGAYLMAHSHVGHDAWVMDGAILACGAKIGGHARIGEHCNVGLNAVVHQRSVLADGCMVGASSFYKKGIDEPFVIYAGVPAGPIKRNDILIQRLQEQGLLDDALAFTGKRISRGPCAGDTLVR